MDQLHMHFASAIHNTAFTIVLGYVELCVGSAGSNFQKRQYQDLCKVEKLTASQWQGLALFLKIGLATFSLSLLTNF